MLELLETLGQTARSSFAKLGRGTFFLLHTLTGIAEVLPRPNLLTRRNAW